MCFSNSTTGSIEPSISQITRLAVIAALYRSLSGRGCHEPRGCTGVPLRGLADCCDGDFNAVVFPNSCGGLGKGMLNAEIAHRALQSPRIRAAADGVGFAEGTHQFTAGVAFEGAFDDCDLSKSALPVKFFFRADAHRLWLLPPGKISIDANSVQAVQSAIRAGLGVNILPLSAVQEDMAIICEYPALSFKKSSPASAGYRGGINPPMGVLNSLLPIQRGGAAGTEVHRGTASFQIEPAHICTYPVPNEKHHSRR